MPSRSLPRSRPKLTLAEVRTAPPSGATEAPEPASSTLTLEGEVVRVTFESESSGFRVLRVQVGARGEPEVVVGVMPPVGPGAKVRATGRWEQDRKHGRQFRSDTLLVLAPATLGGLERYLGSGMIPGIGEAYAKRIVEAFGADTLRILDEQPERLRQVTGLGPRRAEAVAKAWGEHRDISAIMIFLQSHGASPSLAARIHRRFGASALDIVSRRPYRLALDVWGVGFATADRIAQDIGTPSDAPERAQAGLLHTLHELSGRGHVHAPRGELVEQAAVLLQREPQAIEPEVESLVRSGHVRLERGPGGEEVIYPRELLEAEERLARGLLSLVSAAATESSLAKQVEPTLEAFGRRGGVALAPAQRDAVERAATSKVLVVTGGPGVGKTTVVRALLELYARAGLRVRLAAPTGRAAKRMSEATGLEASTLYRLLEFDPKSRAFGRQASRPLELDVLVVDETSMVDLPLADGLVQALPQAARLVLVGDVDQLPSVGPGAVLRDVIRSRVVPTVFLTQIFRQAAGSLIIDNAHRIHDGLPPESAKGKGGEFYLFERSTPEEAAELIHELVTRRIPAGFGLDPSKDIQVLTPMHRGPAGTAELNARLQQALNPDGPSVTRGSRTLRVGDKVMQLRNDYEREVYNGDVGRIARLNPDARELEVDFDGRRVTYSESELDELVLAYATSIHKSQGSEYPAVVVPLLTTHFMMLSRNLLYTAVTRGKGLVILVTDPRALSLALAETRKEERRTGLAERLRQS